MVDAAVAVHYALDGLAARKRRRRGRTAVGLIRKSWRSCFSIRVHGSLDLVRSAGRSPGIAPDLAGVALSKGEIGSSVILTEVRGGGKPGRLAGQVKRWRKKPKSSG